MTKNLKKTTESAKTCLECGGKIHGRQDKKFCSDTCRIAHNNRRNSNETNYIRNVTNALRRNRKILQELNSTGKTKVLKSKLTERGFDFNYFTSIYTTRDGAVYKYCFEQGYLEMEKNFFLLVIKNDV